MGEDRRRYVVVELQGRLGNQLFQFASGYAVARRRSARLRFMSDRVPPGDLLLPRLIGEMYQTATPEELLRVGAWSGGGRAAAMIRSGSYHAAVFERALRRRTRPSFVVWSDTGRYRPDVFEVDLPVRIVGHLQSERYFAEAADEIVRQLGFSTIADERAVPSVPTVGVSFRRGDYNNLGWALPLRYYEAALRMVTKAIGDVQLALFGDDAAFVELAGERLAQYGDVVNVHESDADPIAQLHRMAKCDHMVISNSSFAWWGAWLGDQGERAPHRMVVAPREYVGGDRVPDRWFTLLSGVEAF